MSSTVDELAKNPALLKALQLASISSLSIVSGIAVCLYEWVIPVIAKAPDARTKITQFNLIIEKGYKFLMPFSRILPVTLGSLTYLLSRHPNPAVAARWKLYAAAIAVIASTAPYEILTIFPTNDKLAEMGGELDKERKQNFGDGRDKEVDRLLRKWQVRHVGRIATSVVTLLITLWGVVSSQEFEL